MTLTTLIGPSAVMISKEVLATAGTYSRTPPNGASCVLMKAVGASGASRIIQGYNGFVSSGAGAFISALDYLSTGDSFSLIVPSGGTILGAGAPTVLGGSPAVIKKNSNTILIVPGGGGAQNDSSGYSQAGGGTSFSYNNGSDGLFHGAIDGRAATQNSNGYSPAANVGGGYGRYQGGNGAAAGGGGSYFVDSSLTHALGFPGVYDSPGSTVAGPNAAADPDIPTSSGRGLRNVNGAGVAGAIALLWFTGDPYAAGLLI